MADNAKKYNNKFTMKKIYITQEEKEELNKIYQEFLSHPLILKMKEIPMHRGSNCYLHSFKVTKRVMNKAIEHPGIDYKNLLIASILHDYYLYDWRAHHELKKKHGRNHPSIAISNAKRDFNISEEAAEIIRCHMWPLTPHDYPKNFESKLLNIIDDEIATVEFFTSKKHKKKKEEQYLKKISTLFD